MQDTVVLASHTHGQTQCAHVECDFLMLSSPCMGESHGHFDLGGSLQDVKKHDDPDLVVLATDECLFADEGFR